jgi:hypothetical protein
MRTENLNDRLLYFEGKLHEAQAKYAAKEPHPRSFDAGYTIEVLKTWPDTIDVIKERIVGIKKQNRERSQLLLIT